MSTFGFYKLHANAVNPAYGTEHSACFDLHAHLTDEYGNPRTVMQYNSVGESHEWKAFDGKIHIRPSTTALIPTGLIAQMEPGWSLRVHMRSSVAFKRGLILPNGEGIVDADYYHELFMMVRNVSHNGLDITHGERICQGEWVPVLQFPITEIHTRPQQTTDRVGGFGSTGA